MDQLRHAEIAFWNLLSVSPSLLEPASLAASLLIGGCGVRDRGGAAAVSIVRRCRARLGCSHQIHADCVRDPGRSIGEVVCSAVS